MRSTNVYAMMATRSQSRPVFTAPGRSISTHRAVSWWKFCTSLIRICPPAV